MRGPILALFEQPGRGGVNLQDAPFLLKDFEARDVRNIVATSRGALRKRDGSIAFATPGVALTSLFASQNPKFLIGAGGTLIYSISPTGVVASIKTGMTTSLRWEWADAPASGGQGPVWGMNGTDTPQQWTGAGNALQWTAATGTLPNGKYLVPLGNRLWVAGMASYGSVIDPGSTLVFSNIGDPRDWPAANVVEFDPTDGDSVTGLGTLGSYLLVFKTGKAWVVYDLDTGANRSLAKGVGCVAHRSIVETPAGTFFLSEDHGVMLTNGSTVQRVSDRVLPLIKSMSQAQRAAATAAYFNDHYYLSFSLGGVYNDITLDYDTKLDAWWIHTLGVQDFAAWTPTVDPRLYSARGNAAAVDQLLVEGALTDPAGAFSCYWAGPYHTFGKPEIRKRVRQIRLEGSGRCQVYIAKDYGSATQIALDANVGSDNTLYGVNDGGAYGMNDSPPTVFGRQPSAQVRLPTPGVARAWSLQFGNQTGDPLQVNSYALAATARQD